MLINQVAGTIDNVSIFIIIFSWLGIIFCIESLSYQSFLYSPPSSFVGNIVLYCVYWLLLLSIVDFCLVKTLCEVIGYGLGFFVGVPGSIGLIYLMYRRMIC